MTEHKAKLDTANAKDFTDEMLIKQKEIGSLPIHGFAPATPHARAFPLAGLTDDDIVVILWDMMAGGIDTSATSMVLLWQLSAIAS